MTAEVLIHNKSAVVVAADSAVTVGKNKVHISGNKIFTICDKASIGLMVWGYSEFVGTPWETVAKLFRSEHAEEAFATVELCYKAFRSFLSRKQFLSELDCGLSVARFALPILENIVKAMKEMPRNGRPAGTQAYIDGYIEHFEQHLQGQLTFEAPTLGRFRSNCGDIIDSVIEVVFDDVPFSLPANLRGRVIRLVHAALCSPYVSPHAGGMVMFGFGAEEMTPAYVAHEFDAAPMGLIRSVEYDSERYDEGGAVIISFADDKMINLFLDDISYAMRRLTVMAIRTVAEEVAELIFRDNFDMTADETKISKALADRQIDAIVENIASGFNQHVSFTNAKQILDIIDQMPKDEMATLVEALVELAALKKKVSTEIESVGGPVDVCVISKGDGLIWIKRKHYFELDKNLQYLYRRFGGVSVAVRGDGDGR